MSRVGVTLGKYAPLHKGHQHVIDLMLEEMDEVVVIIYDTHVTDVPLPVRSGWIRTLYPQVRVIEAWDGPDGVPHDPAYERAEEAYVRTLLGDTKVAAFYTSDYYGAHMAAALDADDRRVDSVVPVRASDVRADPYRHRMHVDSVVYRDLVVKAVFLGAMSTGKSTIAEALAERHGTTFVPEYGRTYWEKHQVDRRLGLEAFDEIALGHMASEDQLVLDANRFLFVDTNAITTYMFALDYHGAAPDLLTRLANENPQRYDLFFLCQDDIPYDDTWDRSGDQKRRVFQRQIIADLHRRRVPYVELAGSLDERMATVETVLAEYRPYSNYFGRPVG